MKVDLHFAESTTFQSTLAFGFQVFKEISFLHKHAALRMYTDNFDKLAAVRVALYQDKTTKQYDQIQNVLRV